MQGPQWRHSPPGICTNNLTIPPPPPPPSDPAQLVIRPNQTIAVDAGNDITFTCVACGVPNPSISWNRGDTPLSNGSQATIYEELVTEDGVTFVHSFLQLRSVEETDAGQYSCFANNTLGNDTAFFELAVAQGMQLYNLDKRGFVDSQTEQINTDDDVLTPV